MHNTSRPAKSGDIWRKQVSSKTHTWRVLASTGDNVAPPRLATVKNVAWRLQERRPA
ncbi:hypothetical protein A2U01_0102073, partial [Trifolium medium]|nr:hypothetical protein [Trifolium medium]